MKNTSQLFLTLLLSITTFSVLQAQWSTVNMIEAKVQHANTAHGSKIFIGPGNGSAGPTNQIDVFDLELNEWVEVHEVNIAAAFPVSVYADGKVFVAGGVDFSTAEATDAVDILDAITGDLETATLSQSRFDMSAAVVGDKIIFAGGMSAYNPALVTSDIIDIYDLGTGVWSTATLSSARSGMAVAVAGDIAIFAGGHSGDDMVSDAVDIYNASTDTWSTATLSIGRAYVAGTTIGNRIFLAGGMFPGVNNSSDVVDIYDTSTGTWSTAALSEARGGIRAVTVGNRAYFIGGGLDNLPAWQYISSSRRIDIYDAEEDAWSIDSMVYTRINHNAVAAGNCLFITGGVDFETFQLVDVMEIYCESVSATIQVPAEANIVSISPNPVAGFFTVKLPPEAGAFTIHVLDLQGRLVQSATGVGQVQLDAGEMASGMYLVKVFNREKTSSARIVKW